MKESLMTARAGVQGTVVSAGEGRQFGRFACGYAPACGSAEGPAAPGGLVAGP